MAACTGGLESSNFTTYVGWAVPWDTPLTLLGETTAELARAQRQLARIGMDRPAAAVLLEDVLDRSRPLAPYPVAGFPDLREALDRGRELVVVDVRASRSGPRGTSREPGTTHSPEPSGPGG